MEEYETKDLQCLIAQRLQRPGFARMISWEFSKISDEEQITAKKIRRRKRTEDLKDEESGSDLMRNTKTESLSQNSSVHTKTSTDFVIVDKLSVDTLSIETISSTESEESEYFSAPEDVEINDDDDDTSSGTEESFETTRTSNDVFSSIGASSTGHTHPSERKRRPSKKQKRKRRQEMKCVYINDLYVISNLFDLESDISEANNDGVTLQNPVPSLVQLCLKAASHISEDEKLEIPVGIKKLMSSRNQINSLQRLQLSWLQNNVLASFEPEDTFTRTCLYEDPLKVLQYDTSRGIHKETHVSLFLPTRNILNSIICYKHKAHDTDQIYKGSKVSSYLLNASHYCTLQMNLLQAVNYKQLVDTTSVEIVSCLSALASSIDLMLPHTFSEKLVGQKRNVLGEEEATRVAKETMYIRVRRALEKRFPTVVEHLYDIALPYVMWARGNVQSATEMFINLAKVEKRSKFLLNLGYTLLGKGGAKLTTFPYVVAVLGVCTYSINILDLISPTLNTIGVWIHLKESDTAIPKLGRHKAMYLSEIARMSLQFGDIEKGVKFHHLAADTALEKARYSDAQINEVNEQMLVLVASAYDQGLMLQSKARQAGQSWNSVLHLPSQQEANAIAAITSFLCYHSYHWTDSNWLQEAKLRLQFITKTHPYLSYHLSMVQALLGEEGESKSTFIKFTNSPHVHGLPPGSQVVRMIGNQIRNPWQPLFDMIKNQVTSIQPIKVVWRTQLGHPRSIHENIYRTTDNKLKGEVCEADRISSNLSLHISPNGYLTGDMQLSLPSMRSVYLDPYTGVLALDQIPGLSEPWQTLIADGTDLPQDLFIPTLLELYHDDKGQTVTLFAPQRMRESYSGLKTAWLHWAGAAGEKARINLFQLIKSERKMAVDKAIEGMAGKTQKEKAEMKKMCQLCYDHSYVFSIVNVESAIRASEASEKQDNRRARKKKKSIKRKKYFYLNHTQFVVALHNNKRVGTNILLDISADGIHEFVVIKCTDKQSYLRPEFLKKENTESLADCQYASSANIILLDNRQKELVMFSTEGEKVDVICNKSDIIHHEKQMCVVGSAVYAIGKALDSIFCKKCNGSNDQLEKCPFLDYNVPKKEINSIQIMADELLLIHSKMGISFLDPQNLELVMIQMEKKGSLTLTEDSKVILGNFEVFSRLGTRTWQEENKKITHVGLGLNHHLVVMEITSYPISFDSCGTMCGLPSCQKTLKLIFSIPMPGVPLEVCFINRSVGFFVSITQHLNCTTYYQEMILQIDYYGKLRGVLPCLGPGPRSFFPCYLQGDSDLQANDVGQGQAGIYVYLRDGHDGIIAIRPAM